MKQSQKQYAVVWLDSQNALIITNTSENANGRYTIRNKIESTENSGGGIEDSANNVKQTGNLKYFNTLSGMLLQYDEILIFGPDKLQEQFQNHLRKHPQFKGKQTMIAITEELTDTQMIAKVRDFFKSRQLLVF